MCYLPYILSNMKTALAKVEKGGQNPDTIFKHGQLSKTNSDVPCYYLNENISGKT